jgi:hypothetical protein
MTKATFGVLVIPAAGTAKLMYCTMPCSSGTPTQALATFRLLAARATTRSKDLLDFRRPRLSAEQSTLGLCIPCISTALWWFSKGCFARNPFYLKTFRQLSPRELSSTCSVDAEMENLQLSGLHLLADAAQLKEAEVQPSAVVERQALQALHPNIQRQPAAKASNSKKHGPPTLPAEIGCQLNAESTPPALLSTAESTAANLALLTEAQRDIDDALKQCEGSIFEKETLYYGRGAALALAPTDKLIAFFEATAAQGRVPVSATTDSLPPTAAGLTVLGDYVYKQQPERLFSTSSCSAPTALDLKEVKPHALRLARDAFKQKRQQLDASLKTVPQKAGNGL